MTRQMHFSRRKFIGGLTGAATMTMRKLAWAFDDVYPRAAAIVASTIGIDTHNHIDVPLSADEAPGPAIDLAGEMKRSGLSGICMTFAVDYQRLQTPAEGYERFKNGLNSMSQQLERNHMKRALRGGDSRKLFLSRRTIPECADDAGEVQAKAITGSRRRAIHISKLWPVALR